LGADQADHRLKGYLDFASTGKLLEAGMGFWVNKP